MYTGNKKLCAGPLECLYGTTTRTGSTLNLLILLLLLKVQAQQHQQQQLVFPELRSPAS